jgi:hypothetical protein
LALIAGASALRPSPRTTRIALTVLACSSSRSSRAGSRIPRWRSQALRR